MAASRQFLGRGKRTIRRGGADSSSRIWTQGESRFSEVRVAAARQFLAQVGGRAERLGGCSAAADAGHKMRCSQKLASLQKPCLAGKGAGGEEKPASHTPSSPLIRPCPSLPDALCMQEQPAAGAVRWVVQPQAVAPGPHQQRPQVWTGCGLGVGLSVQPGGHMMPSGLAVLRLENGRRAMAGKNCEDVGSTSQL